LYEKGGGELALKVISRRKPGIKNRIEQHIEKAIVELAVDKPALGQVRVANELAKHGMLISPAGVRCVGLRHDLNFSETAETVGGQSWDAELTDELAVSRILCKRFSAG
jgi:hypothetical protein